jgi:glycosyltransferase involved in cell wall biosynthesis
VEPIVHVIIPAYNEQQSIGKVVAEIPREVAATVIVVNNGSVDETARAARDAGAIVIDEPERGYGRACLTGIDYSGIQSPPPDIIVFLDGDYSDYPHELLSLIDPIVNDRADLVIGSRVLGIRQKGSMTVQQIFGNWLATTLLRILFNARFSDLGPFRAIRFSSLKQLNMQDRTYGWTVEMQVKAAKKKIRFVEVPVGYRKRIGVSKISGTVKGTFLAGYKILYTIFRNL